MRTPQFLQSMYQFGFTKGALTKTGGLHPDVSLWYAGFLKGAVLPYATTWSYAITYGELLVGLGLVVGLFTSLAAFFGLSMNLNFLFAGTVSTNPQLLVLALFVMLAHKIAGFIGLEFYRFFKCYSENGEQQHVQKEQRNKESCITKEM